MSLSFIFKLWHINRRCHRPSRATAHWKRYTQEWWSYQVHRYQNKWQRGGASRNKILPTSVGKRSHFFIEKHRHFLEGGFGVCNFDDRVPTMRSSNLPRRRALPQMRVRGKVKCTRQTPTKGYRYHLHNVTATCLSLSYLVRRLQKGDIVAL